MRTRGGRCAWSLLLVLAVSSCSHSTTTGLPSFTASPTVAPVAPSKPTASAPTVRASADLVPADGQLPATGVCAGPGTQRVVVVDINPDTPEPRCAVISATQVLEVVNTTNAFGEQGHAISVTWSPFPARTVAVGRSTLFDRPFGEYLAAGVHAVRTSMYGGSGPELWLKGG